MWYAQVYTEAKKDSDDSNPGVNLVSSPLSFRKRNKSFLENDSLLLFCHSFNFSELISLNFRLFFYLKKKDNIFSAYFTLKIKSNYMEIMLCIL